MFLVGLTGVFWGLTQVCTGFDNRQHQSVNTMESTIMQSASMTEVIPVSISERVERMITATDAGRYHGNLNTTQRMTKL